MGAQHTPGPWEWDIYARGYVLVGAPRSGSSVRQPVVISHASSDGRLIAAAPDYHAASELALPLLEADRRTFFDCHTINGDPKSLTNEETVQVAAYDAAINALKSAIAKARGAA